MKQKTNKGITLIALVITIIVMLILVSVTINMAVNGGLFNYASKAVGDTNNAYANEQSLGSGAITVDGKNYASIDEFINRYEGLKITATTANVTFTKSDNTTPGDPNNIETGDIVRYGDYIYKYGLDVAPNSWSVVQVEDKTKASYSELCGEIFGKSVTCMYGTFGGCTSLTQAPEIPNSVTNMYGTFGGCTSLTQAPEIPNSVTNMYSTFAGCTSLTQVPEIPNSVTYLGATFQGCTSLTLAPEIPNSVTNMGYTFAGCTNLEGNIVINANPTSYSGCFGGTVKAITLLGEATIQTKQNLQATATANPNNITIP